ncbi:hypothetical protein BTHERMOSOX_1767 [Bathymodiolus thermophilus thioautotrophic gill symbiont]|nr:hypothetical protein BTHERMOSOX_1767 [Bathymodiolus thermophilus thioautotrophic gill symbiont]
MVFFSIFPIIRINAKISSAYFNLYWITIFSKNKLNGHLFYA